MTLCLNRCGPALLIILLVAVGGVIHGFAAVQPDAAAIITMAAGPSGMDSETGPCGSADAAAGAACQAICAGAVALPSAMSPLAVSSDPLLRGTTTAALCGHSGAPDPHPPRRA